VAPIRLSAELIIPTALHPTINTPRDIIPLSTFAAAPGLLPFGKDVFNAPEDRDDNEQ
jgi:hypothetical protein